MTIGGSDTRPPEVQKREYEEVQRRLLHGDERVDRMRAALIACGRAGYQDEAMFALNKHVLGTHAALGAGVEATMDALLGAGFDPPADPQQFSARLACNLLHIDSPQSSAAALHQHMAESGAKQSAVEIGRAVVIPGQPPATVGDSLLHATGELRVMVELARALHLSPPSDGNFAAVQEHAALAEGHLDDALTAHQAMFEQVKSSHGITLSGAFTLAGELAKSAEMNRDWRSWVFVEFSTARLAVDRVLGQLTAVERLEVSDERLRRLVMSEVERRRQTKVILMAQKEQLTRERDQAAALSGAWDAWARGRAGPDDAPAQPDGVEPLTVYEREAAQHERMRMRIDDKLSGLAGYVDELSTEYFAQQQRIGELVVERADARNQLAELVGAELAQVPLNPPPEYYNHARNCWATIIMALHTTKRRIADLAVDVAAELNRPNGDVGRVKQPLERAITAARALGNLTVHMHPEEVGPVHAPRTDPRVLASELLAEAAVMDQPDDADRAALLRRAAAVLTGFAPPAPEEDVDGADEATPPPAAPPDGYKLVELPTGELVPALTGTILRPEEEIP